MGDGAGTLDLGGGEEPKADEEEATKTDESSSQKEAGWQQVGQAPYDPNYWYQQNQYDYGEAGKYFSVTVDENLDFS